MRFDRSTIACIIQTNNVKCTTLFVRRNQLVFVTHVSSVQEIRTRVGTGDDVVLVAFHGLFVAIVACER